MYAYCKESISSVAIVAFALLLIGVLAAVASAQSCCGGPRHVRVVHPNHSAHFHALEARQAELDQRLHALHEAHAAHHGDHHVIEERQNAAEHAQRELREGQLDLRARQHFVEDRQQLLADRQQLLEDRQAFLQDSLFLDRRTRIFNPRDVVSLRQQTLIDNIEAGLEDPFDRVFLDGIQLDEFEELVGNLGVQSLQSKLLLFDRSRTRAGFRRGATYIRSP